MHITTLAIASIKKMLHIPIKISTKYVHQQKYHSSSRKIKGNGIKYLNNGQQKQLQEK